jgi:hypothetical protein
MNVKLKEEVQSTTKQIDLQNINFYLGLRKEKETGEWSLKICTLQPIY